MFGMFLLEGKQRVSIFCHDLSLLPKLSSDFAQSRRQLGARDFHQDKQRISPFYHDLGLDLVGLIGKFGILVQLLPLLVEHLLNPILSSSHVSRKSLEEDEVTHILSRI